MANFNVKGFDDVEKQLLQQTEKAAEVIPLMLEAGADILVKAQQEEVDRLFGISKRSKGDLKRSIKKGKVKSATTEATITVAPTGKDSKGVRNAEKGFVLEYGKHGMQPQHWMETANIKSEAAAHEKMVKVWEEENDGS